MVMSMDITPYVDSLRRDLVAASEAGGDDIRRAAERLALALDPSARLAASGAWLSIRRVGTTAPGCPKPGHRFKLSTGKPVLRPATREA